MSAEPALAKIHEQEGEGVENVDGGERVVELDGIEQNRSAVDLDDVAQMQIAMAVAHIAGTRPRSQQGRERGKPLATEATKLERRLGRKDVRVGGKGPLVIEQHPFERHDVLIRREQSVGRGVK